MKRPLIIVAGVVAAIAAIVVIVLLNLSKDAGDGVAAPGSKDSVVTASPIPTPTSSAPPTDAHGKPEDRREMPKECLDEDTAPDYCMSIIPPDAGPTVTAEQMSTESVAAGFVAEWGRWETGEGAAARAARLAPFLDPSASSVTTKPTMLARPETGLVNLTGTAKTTVLFAAFINDDSGKWTYQVTATYNATYTQGGTGTISNYSGPATFTVTIDSATKKVTDVSESIPTLDRAP